MNTAINIGWVQLGLCFLFIMVGGVASVSLRLGLQKDLWWGAVRTFAQLFLLGLILKHVFEVRLWWPVLGLFWLMVVFAVFIIRGRIQEKAIRYWDSTFISMFLSFTLITFLVTKVIVQVDPWYQPRYFLPLGGMIIGNSMNAIAISLDRLFSELRRSSKLVEMRLSLGASWLEAGLDIARNAVKAGLIPSINAMMGAGLVFIPGMMTGQILAGADEIMAVKYQVMVMFMLVGSTAVGSLLAVFLSLNRCFSREGTPRLR